MAYPSVYPTSLDSYTTKTDNVDSVMAVDVNELQSAIVAIETKLGTGQFLCATGNGATWGFKAGATLDVLWYRGAADTWRTPDAVTVDGVSILTGRVDVGGANLGCKLNIKAADVNAIFAATSDYVYTTTGSSFQILFGANTGNTYTRLVALTTGATAWGTLTLQDGGGKVGIGTTAPTAVLHVVGLVDYANNAAAVAAGLTAGAFYTETGTNPKRVCVTY